MWVLEQIAESRQQLTSQHSSFSQIQQKALLALIGLAFVIITAGVYLMQTFYAARGVLSTPGISPQDAAIIGRQAGILFPTGYLLLIVGLAMVVSVLLQPVFRLKLWLTEAKSSNGAWWVFLAAVTAVMLFFVLARWPTYASLGSDFMLHIHALYVMFFLTAWGTFALRKALAIIDNAGPPQKLEN